MDSSHDSKCADHILQGRTIDNLILTPLWFAYPIEPNCEASDDEQHDFNTKVGEAGDGTGSFLPNQCRGHRRQVN